VQNPVESPVSVSCELGGRTLTIETGRIARQAHGSVTVRMGETLILASATSAPSRPNPSFFPLTVDYRESTTAAGKFPGGFFKREGRPSTKEILTARCIDRPIRPLFPDGYMKEVFVAALVWSFDDENDPDVLSMIGASAALALSEMPWGGPIGACRVGKVDDELIINPTYEQREEGSLDLVMAATSQAITMVEAGASELTEEEMVDALFAGEEACRQVAALIEELVAKCKPTKLEFTLPETDEELKEKVLAYADRVKAAGSTPGKHHRSDAIRAVRDEAIEELTSGLSDEEEIRERTAQVKELFEELLKKVIRARILEEGVRDDARKPDEVRQINIEVGVLPRSHGSALFTRGETQAMVSLTLGSVMDDQRVEGLRDPVRQKFMLHYNFPSYCVGEAWPNRGPKRREIGHGSLAERALKPLVPAFEHFPYTLRIRSDITESNGSSSMASVCGGTLALMDGGVRLRRPVAGIAMGLIKEGDRYVILSDILGSEDHSGDMDFKVAGTQRGITALQMDIKTTGLTRELLCEALGQARKGRIHVLREMLAALREPRASLSAHAPRILQVPIDNEKIGALIGPGGSVIRKLQEETNTKIAVDEDRELAVISGGSDSKLDVAEQMVSALTATVEIGTRYSGRVVNIRDFGCFVELLPGLEALCHISELASGYVESVRDVVQEDDVIEVEVIDVDAQGRVKVSKRRVDGGEDDDADDEDEGGRGREKGRDRGRKGGAGGRSRSRGRERSRTR
jgi:polyribonucleotide nucleotidyltransferase